MLRRVKYKGKSIEYELKLTDRKSIECRVAPGRATVFAPVRTRPGDADAFVLSHAEWIEQALRQAGANAEAIVKRQQESIKDGALIPIEGREYPLLCLPGEKTLVRIDGDRLVVLSPHRDPLKIRDDVREYLIRLAQARFRERILFYAPKIGVQPGRITLREQRTKWGSCSGRGNLNFNWKLIMAPPGALDSVVVHELCHLIELNHSPAFWSLVKKHMPDYDTWHDYLKNGIRTPFD